MKKYGSGIYRYIREIELIDKRIERFLVSEVLFLNIEEVVYYKNCLRFKKSNCYFIAYLIYLFNDE